MGTITLKNVEATLALVVSVSDTNAGPGAPPKKYSLDPKALSPPYNVFLDATGHGTIKWISTADGHDPNVSAAIDVVDGQTVDVSAGPASLDA